MNDLVIPVFIVIAFLLLNSSEEKKEISECHLEVHTGDEILRLQLGVDTMFTVMGNLGEMEISIENERARIASSPCPGQDCVRQGWLRKPGDMAVCVPSGVFIIISADNDSLSPDAVSY
jgi:hypothetical protein